MARRHLTFLITLAFVAIVGFGVSLLARGYRFDTKNIGLRPTGLLVVTSDPDGAEIIINGQLESATNATITLPPETYDVEIRKDSYLPWRKRLTIKKEEVTKVDTVLFPAAPSLSALTFRGAIRPVLSPDGTKIAFGVPFNPQVRLEEQKGGLWIMDLGGLPIGFSTDPRQISNLNPENATWVWSPDSRQILVYSANSNYLLNTSELTLQDELINIQGTRLEKTLETWKSETNEQKEDLFKKLPPELQDILRRKTKSLSFSPDETKVLYTASGSAVIKEKLTSELPGSSTQKQARNLEEGKTYIYDLKEDRNFLVTDKQVVTDDPQEKDRKTKISWFPTSSHLLLAEPERLTIMDYDSTNAQVVWAGPYEAPYAIPSPDRSRLLILTSFGAGGNQSPNLYSLSLK